SQSRHADALKPAYSDVDEPKYTFSYVFRHAEQYADSQLYSYSAPIGYLNSHSFGDPYADSFPDSESDQHAERYGYGQRQPDLVIYANRVADADCYANGIDYTFANRHVNAIRD